MGARLRSWWQRVRKPLEIIFVIVGCILVIALLVVIALAYIFNVNVPGLHGKTLWDWLQLLIIPLALAVIAIIFNRSERKNEQRIASDNQQAAALQEYIKEMSELLLHEKLRESQPKDEVRTIARVRTLTILPRLDANRKGSVLQFLDEADLIDKDGSFIDLSRADFSGANLSDAKLARANLIKANLREADLSKAMLFEANLREADLSKANLHNAILSLAHLFPYESQANLNETNLSEADLSRAYLGKVNLRDANLCGANLSGADLQQADMSGANLKGVTGVTVKELEKQAESLKGATMPDGSKHP